MKEESEREERKEERLKEREIERERDRKRKREKVKTDENNTRDNPAGVTARLYGKHSQIKIPPFFIYAKHTKTAKRA